MGETVRILCVDDEPNVLRSLVRMFLEQPYEILTASSGEEGLSILAGDPRIPIVISDYRMPGMNGVDFLREVFRRWPETVRIVLSGYADAAAVVSAVNEGQIYRFIPKPWNEDELKAAVSKALERHELHKRGHRLAEDLRSRNEELRKTNEVLDRIVKEMRDRGWLDECPEELKRMMTDLRGGPWRG